MAASSFEGGHQSTSPAPLRGPTSALSTIDPRHSRRLMTSDLREMSLENFDMWMETVDQIDDYKIAGMSLLSIAGREHRLDIAELLIHRGGVSVESGSDVAGRTPLMGAVLSRDVEFVKYLLGKGADIDRVLWPGSTAVTAAISLRSVELVGLLIEEGADVRVGGFALVEAANQGDIDIVEILLRNGADINQATMNGRTPLMAAAWSVAANRDQAFVHLVQRGANIDQTDLEGRFGIAVAVSVGRADITSLFLRNGADIGVVDETGATLRIMAAREGNVEVVRLLIEAGIDVEAVDNVGDSALDLAIRGRDYNPEEEEEYEIIVNLIIQAIEDNPGMTILK